MDKVKVVFVGTGGLGQQAHLANYAALDELCEITAIVEPRPMLAAAVAARYNVKQVYHDYEALLEKESFDAIIAPQQYRKHSIIIPDLLRAGKPILTEKPLCLTVEAGEELVRIGEQQQTRHMVGYHKRSDPAMEYAKACVEDWKKSGDYGKLRYIRISMPPGDWWMGADKPLMTDEPYPEGEWEPYSAQFSEQQNRDYDSFVNYYIHQINAIRYVLDEPYQLTFGDRSGVLLAGESESGVCVSLEMAAYHTSIEWQETVFIAFEKGYIQVELPAPLARQLAGKVSVMTDNGHGQPALTQPIMPNLSAMRKQAINFLAAVKGAPTGICTAKEALEDLKLAEHYIHLMSAYSAR
ncbi:putative dehydrogenase [Paenibacillus endophyticus]|uniref:Putative dehydrogenase n=1 Tax=Paenibacillus endophyticus TaxID=1294268 RepID=A0A7W5C5Y8_9BACL|nr:Gfo/Idh/MocA family oxidoreductase [Paenibacillus endophyticus]MBB3151410.1 putative dehydrogenase [Paenibacillus endophyticus]